MAKPAVKAIDRPKEVLEGTSPKINPVVLKEARVIGCRALRLREGANAKSKIVMIINENALVKVDLEQSTKTFYKVVVQEHPSIIEGFCMKEFIRVS